jgi:hypothetical protein
MDRLVPGRIDVSDEMKQFSIFYTSAFAIRFFEESILSLLHIDISYYF